LGHGCQSVEPVELTNVVKIRCEIPRCGG
jgi:hypothetical protein